jgi:hypothetical protein
MRAFSNLIIVFTQLEIYKLQSVVSCNSNWFQLNLSRNISKFFFFRILYLEN